MGFVSGEHCITHHNDANVIAELLRNLAVFTILNIMWVDLYLTLKLHLLKKSSITRLHYLKQHCVGFILKCYVCADKYVYRRLFLMTFL